MIPPQPHGLVPRRQPSERHDRRFARFPGRPMLLWGRAVTWLIGGRRKPGQVKLGQKRLGAFGSLPVRDGGSPVERCLPLVPEHVADPCRCCPFVHADDTLVRLGRPAERLRAGGQHFHGSSVRLGRVAPGRFQPLPGGGGPALDSVPVSFPELFSRARTASSRVSISR